MSSAYTSTLLRTQLHHGCVAKNIKSEVFYLCILTFARINCLLCRRVKLVKVAVLASFITPQTAFKINIVLKMTDYWRQPSKAINMNTGGQF